MGLTLDAPVIMATAARTHTLILQFAVAGNINQPRKKPGIGRHHSHSAFVQPIVGRRLGATESWCVTNRDPRKV